MTHEPPVTPHEPPSSLPSPEPVAGPPADAVPPVAPPPPPESKGGAWKIILIIGGIVAVLCCLGAVALGIWGFNAFNDATGPVKDTASAYLEDVKEGNYGAAYDRLCASAKRQVTQQEFAQAQSMLPKITDYKVTGVNVSKVNGKTTGTVDAKVTRELFGEVEQTIQLVKEDGKWKVCQIGV